MNDWFLWGFLFFTGFWIGAAVMYLHFRHNRLIRNRQEWMRAMQRAAEEEE